MSSLVITTLYLREQAMKIINNLKTAFRDRYYRIMVSRHLKKVSNNVLMRSYSDVVDCLNHKKKTNLQDWQVKIGRDCLVKEIRRRKLM